MSLTPDERELLGRYVTDPDGDVFALTDLPEVVKGALFARYSRYGGSLKRLFLDEFAADLTTEDPAARAEALYQRVFSDYGDDSVAQLGGAHVALEEVSNLLTKRIEWGRLAAYLEQSTRYIAYDGQVDGRYRYHRPAEVMAGPHADAFETELDAIFATYADLVPVVLDWVRTRWPQDEATSDFVYRNATKAKALDLLRGLLPAATTSNVGMFASGQAYESLLMHLNADDLAESHDLSTRLLAELRRVIPSFLTRVDRPDRGGAWSDQMRATRHATRDLADWLVTDAAEPADLVTLTDWSPRDPVDAEVALVTAALYPHVRVSETQLAAEVATWDADRRAEVLAAYVGERANRRHRPGRGFERVWYRFDVLGDYGGFRDLQRHRMLTIEWQDLTTRHGYETPPELEEAGVGDRWHEALARSAALYERLLPDHPAAAQYAVCFAYRVRYVMQLNARAAMQMLELRSTPQGHPQYRKVVQEMHRLIGDVAGHRAVADAMVHVDHGTGELERLESERAAEARRTARGQVAT
ncbi:FAD-dependent thymidylate synthase [Nitriliruptor alkaliphilus]|uniref:FAD-dependent thymidylate synthase n=1 Tax=Nitriliruptor alkaliphilus TaxID=427918 RepID=UPI001B803D32|nr:FAD-dependent thymidylate synthase [Nitriliruptor alkaliphilus]